VLTVAKYMSPSGISIHGTGLEPSVPVAASNPLDDATDEEAPETDRPDRILEKAIEVLSEKTEQKAAA